MFSKFQRQKQSLSKLLFWEMGIVGVYFYSFLLFFASNGLEQCHGRHWLELAFTTLRKSESFLCCCCCKEVGNLHHQIFGFRRLLFIAFLLQKGLLQFKSTGRS